MSRISKEDNANLCNPLISLLKEMRNNGVGEVVDARIREIKKMCKMPSREIFKELCFCILTANFSAERSLKIQQEIDDGFLDLTRLKLAEKLRALGYRFPNTRACYIDEARRHLDSLKNLIESCKEEREMREWLVNNVKGFGYKEASHFLRNIGFKDLAIIDFHIIELLARYGLVKKTKSLSKSRYLEIEKMLSRIAEKTNLSLAELDLHLWYIETGKILK